MKFTDFVTYFNTAVTKPGQNGSEFEVHFSTHWFIEQHGLTAPNNENFISRVKAYLNNISVSIDELGKTFDISFK
jgi:hypothetical protein